MSLPILTLSVARAHVRNLYTFFGQPDSQLRRARPEWASNERVGATSPHAAVTSQLRIASLTPSQSIVSVQGLCTRASCQVRFRSLLPGMPTTGRPDPRQTRTPSIPWLEHAKFESQAVVPIDRSVARRSESGVLQACEQTGFRCVRFTQLADGLRELGGVPFLYAYIAQIREERHRSVVVARPPCANECVDLLPDLAFSLGEAGQVSIAGDLFLAFAPCASPSFPLPGNLVPRLRHRLGALPQGASRPQGQAGWSWSSVLPIPPYDFGAHAPISTSHTREQRHVLVWTEAGQSSLDVLE
jgi:hypothetical protein